METPEQNNEPANTNWRTDESLSGEPIPALKVKDRESKTFIFLNEGEKKTHPDFGTSIVFSVEHNKVKHNYYVKENNFSLLRQLKEIGVLTGLAVTLSRTGSRKSDTRYTLVKTDLQQQQVQPQVPAQTEQAPVNAPVTQPVNPAPTVPENQGAKETFAGAPVSETVDTNQ